MITRGIQLNLDPAQWRKHLFGLPQERWDCLRGRSFWITGAGTGYGRCLAVVLAAAGARVFLTGRRKQKLQETLDEMKHLDVPTADCHLIAADITDYNQIKAAAHAVRGMCDTLYGLINNAALPARGDVRQPLLRGSIEDWDRIMNTNVKAPWLLTRDILVHMIKGSALRVLFISSEAGWAFTPGYGQYNISKAALNNLGASMAEEFAIAYPDADIQMNILVAGEARTEMNQGSNESPYIITCMALLLLSHPSGGPNGRFFYWDGRHGSFCHALPYEKFVIS